MRNLSSYVLAAGLTACAAGGHATSTEVRTVSQGEIDVIDPGKVGKVECAFQEVNAVKNGVREKCCLVFPGKKACWEGSLAEMGSANVKVVGKERIVGFNLVKGQVSVQEYKDYVVSKLNSVEDVGVFVEQMVSYKEMGDGLFSANEVLESGGGDCDNLANLFKDLLFAVGEREGVDYQVKIVGMRAAKHAIAVFLDRDKKWKGFDQHMPFIELTGEGGNVDLVKGSNYFLEVQKGAPDEVAVFFERIRLEGDQFGKGAFYDRYLEKGGLQTMENKLIVNAGVGFNKAVNLFNFCPVLQCENVESVQIGFIEVTVFLEEGKLDQIQYESGVVNVEFFDLETGLIKEVHYRNGDVAKFDNGKLKQKVFSEGKVDVEFYNLSSGNVVQRDFRDKHIEWYDESGKLIQIRDRDGNVEMVGD